MKMLRGTLQKMIYVTYSVLKKTAYQIHMQCNYLTIKYCSDTQLNTITSFRFKCKRCINNIQVKLPPEDSDCTSDLSQWYHCTNNKGLPDTILSQAWDVAKSVSFVFHHRSSAAEVNKPDINPINKTVDEKKKKYRNDSDYEEDDSGKDDDGDEDFVL